MENESNIKPRFRWGRLFLMMILAMFFMAVGYVGGNYLKNRLIKKLDELEEAEREAETEETDYKEVKDEQEQEEKAEDSEEKETKIVDLVSGLWGKTTEEIPQKPKSETVGFKLPKKPVTKKK